jgi:hypothetical protein
MINTHDLVVEFEQADQTIDAALRVNADGQATGQIVEQSFNLLYRPPAAEKLGRVA